MVKSMDTIVNLCKARGYIYPGSEIYGGLANTWDYGPLGVELKNNVKKLWRKKFIQESKYNVGLDAAILMNPLTWEASGHIGGFSDPLIDCKECKTRHRADKLIEEWAHENGKDMIADGLTDEEMLEYMNKNNICCPNCGKHNFTGIRKFNLMFKTFQGVTEDAKAEIYLRPETAQGIFVNFKNVMRTTRKKLPMGIAQIGKAFRNEITPGNFTFRTREFEQMELEFFCKPGTDIEWYEYWKKFCEDWLLKLGMKEENIRLRDHSPEELVFYSKATTDIEYAFPFGWGELWGIADRTDYDLSNHMRVSKEDFMYLDPETNEKYIPYCIEPSLGADRVTLAFLCNAYDEEEIAEGDTRVVLHLHPALAPYKVAVLPLSKKLSEKAEEIYTNLSKKFMCEYDEAGSIGKRYRREDEIGTPYCVTIDFETMNDNCVTIRDRDTMEQVRVKNEITPGNFTFRTREFEQMELEFFCKPGTDIEWYEYWKKFCEDWLLKLGMKEENIRLRDHSPEELVFYSKATTDIEYAFPFGWGELWGIADRTDYDLSNHMRVSKEDFMYLDPETNEKYIPYCIEPSLGADRVTLAFLCNAYDEEEIAEGDTRVVLHLHPALAPYKVAVLPLSKKLSEKAEEIYTNLSKKFMCEYDEAGSIGKRYRREDEIGTPYCVTIDFETMNDNCVTIRDRDTMEQVRVNIDELEKWISDKIEF